MAGERFTNLAVDALADYLSANYETYLRSVEADLSLSANDLPDPDSYLRAGDVPWDNRTRMDIFEEDWVFEDDYDDMMVNVICAIVWRHRSDADPEGGELLARQCLTALIECLWGDRSLGSKVNACLFGPGSSGAVTEDKITDHAFKQLVTVRLQEVM